MPIYNRNALSDQDILVRVISPIRAIQNMSKYSHLFGCVLCVCMHEFCFNKSFFCELISLLTGV